MNYIGAVKSIRAHPLTPLEVEFEMGDGRLTQWMPVTHAAWQSVVFPDLKAAIESGVEVLVADTMIESPSRFVVTAFLPSMELPLPSNTRKLARVGDSVGVTGTSTPVTLGIPAMSAFKGVIK